MSEPTAEAADTCNSQRLASAQAYRSERYAWAKQVDPEAVKAFEAALKERMNER